MLQFDIRGNITPGGLLKSKLHELEQYFVHNIESNTRKDHFNKYLKYSNDLKSITGSKCLKQWINGSFVNSRNINPKDIDFLTFIDSEIIIELGERLNNFRPAGCWEFYEVDAYIIEVHPSNSPLFNRFTLSDMSCWQEWFSQTRRYKKGQKYSKGFLEIYF